MTIDDDDQSKHTTFAQGFAAAAREEDRRLKMHERWANLSRGLPARGYTRSTPKGDRT